MNQHCYESMNRFSKMANRLFESQAAMLRVMAHPVRLAILFALRERSRSVGDISAILEMTQPNVSQHLSVLRREGLISYNEDGQKRNYFIRSPESVGPLLDVLLDKCGADNKQAIFWNS